MRPGPRGDRPLYDPSFLTRRRSGRRVDHDSAESRRFGRNLYRDPGPGDDAAKVAAVTGMAGASTTAAEFSHSTSTTENA
jgi:hypothetical protein